MLDSETRAPAVLHTPLGVMSKLKADWKLLPELKEFARTHAQPSGRPRITAACGAAPAGAFS